MNKYGGDDFIYMNEGVFKNRLGIQDSGLLETAEQMIQACIQAYHADSSLLARLISENLEKSSFSDD